jgi:DNA-binding XRE family transcriptional regulator
MGIFLWRRRSKCLDPADRAASCLGFCRLEFPTLWLFCDGNNVGNCRLANYQQKQTIYGKMDKRRKQVQPLSGPERAFGKVMREARKKQGMSQMDLHVKSGLDRTFISDLERGIQCPSLITILRVAKALNIAASTMILRTVESRIFVFPDREVI